MNPELTTEQWFDLAAIVLLAILVVEITYALLTARRPRQSSGDATGPESTNRILLWIAEEPARFRSYVVAVVGAFATFLAAFAGVNLSNEQIAATVGLIFITAVSVSEVVRRAVSPAKEQT